MCKTPKNLDEGQKLQRECTSNGKGTLGETQNAEVYQMYPDIQTRWNGRDWGVANKPVNKTKLAWTLKSFKPYKSLRSDGIFSRSQEALL